MILYQLSFFSLFYNIFLTNSSGVIKKHLKKSANTDII